MPRRTGCEIDIFQQFRFLTGNTCNHSDMQVMSISGQPSLWLQMIPVHPSGQSQPLFQILHIPPLVQSSQVRLQSLPKVSSRHTENRIITNSCNHDQSSRNTILSAYFSNTVTRANETVHDSKPINRQEGHRNCNIMLWYILKPDSTVCATCVQFWLHCSSNMHSWKKIFGSLV